MAKAGKNLILHGVSGKLGDQIVIRQVGGETILSQAPGKREAEPTAAQAAHRQRFQQAIIYGKRVMGDADLRAEYESRAEGLKSAFNVAVADFMHAPQIEEIDLTQYGGNSGDTIRIRAVDDFKVTAAHVAIYNTDGSLVEEGEAVQQENGLDWVYTCTADNPETAGDRIVVTVTDQPGGITEKEEILS
ncbi:MAG: hypothetical protein Kow0037_14510 [Calditrichia bacterium]